MNPIKQNIVKRFIIFYLVMLVGLVAIIVKMYDTMYVDGDFWRKLGAHQSRIVEVYPERGNILACDGKLLAASVPTYKLHMDLRAAGMTRELFDSLMPPLADSLALFFGVPAAEMRKKLSQGYKKGNRYMLLSPKKVSYVDLKKIKEFPLFNLGANTGGLIPYKQVSRNNPFRPLSLRTVGALYAEKDKGGKCGIEQYYDSLLRGTPGISQEVFAGSRKHLLTIEDPKDGNDIMTTLDVDIMDITDNALREMLEKTEAARGCAVVMEVASGQIKAMSNLRRTESGDYIEAENFAVNSETEPGSTFKIASAIVALEDGVDTSKIVDTGNGTWKIYGQTMRDWNYYKGGYGKISLNRGIQVSSNIVIAKIIEEKYNQDPMRYIEALYKMGLNTPLNLELNGVAKPEIKNTSNPQWSKTSLPWISHGYELKFPPINLLTFYNGIANGGKMIQPYLVKGVYHNGELVEDKQHVTVINERLCSPKTLDKVQQMMVDVVEKGTAKNVKSDYFKIAGKTGTAVQTLQGKRKHQLTFCGYFPADKPKYTMIVVVWHPAPHINPSAGGISGTVFKNIAERVYAISPLTRTYISQTEKHEGENLFFPTSKDGNYDDLAYTLDKLDLKRTEDGKITSGWCRSEATDKGIIVRNQKIFNSMVPNVVGMGAKDAVFLLENRGMKVTLNGVGSVYSQSAQVGEPVIKGMRVELNLR